MKQQIAHISVHQTSKVLGIAYAMLGFIMFPLIWLASLADPQGAFPIWFALLFPIIYAVFGYIFTALFVAVYNVIASRTGGIEMTLRFDGDPASSA